MSNHSQYNSRHAEYEQVKAKRNKYPYNLLLSTFSGVCGEAQASNLEIMMRIAARRDSNAVIALAKFKDGMRIDEIKSKFKCSRLDVITALDKNKDNIIKYKDSLFNGFNNSRLCCKLRKEFKSIGIPDSIILNLNACKIYDIEDLVAMSSDEFIKALTSNLNTDICADIISDILPILNKAGYDITKLTSHSNNERITVMHNSSNSGICVADNNVSIYADDHISDEEENIAKIYRIDPNVDVYFVCPYCGKHSSLKFHVKTTSNGGIYVDNFFGKECECPSCGSKIKLKKNNSLF